MPTTEAVNRPIASPRPIQTFSAFRELHESWQRHYSDRRAGVPTGSLNQRIGIKAVSRSNRDQPPSVMYGMLASVHWNQWDGQGSWYLMIVPYRGLDNWVQSDGGYQSQTYLRPQDWIITEVPLSELPVTVRELALVDDTSNEAPADDDDDETNW